MDMTLRVVNNTVFGLRSGVRSWLYLHQLFDPGPPGPVNHIASILLLYPQNGTNHVLTSEDYCEGSMRECRLAIIILAWPQYLTYVGVSLGTKYVLSYCCYTEKHCGKC